MKKNFIFLLTSASIVMLMTACEQEIAVAPNRTDIHLDSNGQVGSHLVDKDGNTLYYFSNDANGESACIGGCTTNWEKFYADTVTTTYGDGLMKSDFATIEPSSGSYQTTYKGWPLYYYRPGGVREAAGQTRGEGVGNVWFVAKTNYSIMIANFQLTDAAGVNYLSTYALGNGRTSYFTDEKGNTLYFFTRDSAFISKSTNTATWPVYGTDNIVVPTTLDKTLFVMIMSNGRKHLTYKGWPLYYHTPDNFVRGANKGFRVPTTQPAGSIWPVAIRDIALAPR